VPVVTIALVLLNIAIFVLFQFHGNVKPLIELPGPRASVPIRESEASFLYERAAVPCEVLHQRALTLGEISRTLDLGKDHSCGIAPTFTRTERTALYPKKSIWLSVLSSMFFHGDIVHLAGNMLFLWLFGNNVEDRWGRVAFVTFYLAGGVVATLGHVLSAPSSTVPLVGASGAIAAVMGAYLVLFPKVRIRALLGFIPVRLPAWAMLAAWFVSQFFVAPSAGVAWMAHVVGFAFGILVALLARNVNRPADPVTVLGLGLTRGPVG
jgi:membrane associated rhomboid family serine protease